MADNTRIWSLIHAERRAVADTIDGLSPEQWTHASLVKGWTVGQLAGHMLRAAEQSPGRFLKQMARSGFRFDKSMDDTARASDLDKEQIVARMRQRLTTTNHPPGPPVAMLGEVVVHGEDLRRPLHLSQRVSDEAVNECLDMYAKTNFPVGGKKRIAGLRMVTTDTGWSHGDGPEVRGPGLSVLLATTGRAAGLDDLEGDGVAVLRQRIR
jgi:uncharacterized protein (TIGR03083 family)